jgi:hypothetical protein
MIEHAPLLLGLALFDALVIAGFWLYLRTRSRLPRGSLAPVALALGGFVFHALLFFRGAILILQLATIAALLALWWLSSAGRLPGRRREP